VNISSTHCHCSGSFFEDALIFLPKILDHPVHDFILAMAELAVIYMKTNSHLLTFNDLVGDTWIIRIDGEINVRQTFNELPVV
jgi:hypothetical protein